MAAIVRPNQAHTEAVVRRPSTARSSAPRLTVVRGGRSSEHLAIVYRRRRVAAACVVVILLLGLVVTGRAVALAVAPAPPGSGPAVAAPADEVTQVVVVQPGDTLWGLARRLRPQGDVRPLVDRLADAHGPGPLQPGERLEVVVEPG